MAATLEQTVGLIETALDDMKKNQATKAEVLELINARTEEDKLALANTEKQLKELQDARSEVDELKEMTNQMKGRMDRLRQSGALKDASGAYHGKLRSIEEARQLGLMLMAASMSNMLSNAEINAKHARVMSALEKAGTELIYVEEKSGKRIEKAASGGSQASGSLLVTSEMGPGLIMLLEQYGVIRRLAGRVPMGAGSTLTPKMDALPTFYVPGEGTATTVTDPTVGAVNLIAKTLTALGAYSMELDEDSAVELGELYANWFARGAAYYEDLCGILGDGTSTYFGMRGITGALLAVDATIGNIKSLAVGTGNAYSELVYGDFQKVMGTLPDYADNPNTRWLMSRYFYYTVFVRAALAAGTAGAHEEIILGTAQRTKTALGIPVEFSQVMPKAEANSQICAILGDLSLGVQFGTRGVMEFAQSDQRYFDQGLIAIRCRERVAINAHGVGDTTNAGPICGLITAAS